MTSSPFHFTALSHDRTATPPPSATAAFQQMEIEFTTPSTERIQSCQQGGADEHVAQARRFGTAITNAPPQPHNATPVKLVPTPLSECPVSTVHGDGPYFGAVFGNEAEAKGAGCLTYTSDEEEATTNIVRDVDSPKAMRAPPPTPFCDQRSDGVRGDDEAKWSELTEGDDLGRCLLLQKELVAMNASGQPIVHSASSPTTCAPRLLFAQVQEAEGDQTAAGPQRIDRQRYPIAHREQQPSPKLQTSFSYQLTNSLLRVSERDATGAASRTEA